MKKEKEDEEGEKSNLHLEFEVRRRFEVVFGYS